MANYLRKRHSNGTVFWYKNKQIHRDDGPAIEWDNGDNWWYMNGKLHNNKGPAVINADGSCEWWLNGKQVSKDTVEPN